MHTERRSSCVLKWRITCRRPVIADVITLDPNMRIRYSILTLLAITLVVALLVVVAQRQMQPTYSLHFHNDTNAEISDLSLSVSPVLSGNSGDIDEFNRQLLLPGESVVFRHERRYPSVDFRYTARDRKFEYTNVDISGRREAHLRTNPNGDWAGGGG